MLPDRPNDALVHLEASLALAGEVDDRTAQVAAIFADVGAVAGEQAEIWKLVQW